MYLLEKNLILESVTTASSQERTRKESPKKKEENNKMRVQVDRKGIKDEQRQRKTPEMDNVQKK